MEISWLDALEEKVQLATQRIRELTEENRSLRSRIKDLEDPSVDSSEWQTEKQAIRERVEKLASGLESLLEEE